MVSVREMHGIDSQVGVRQGEGVGLLNYSRTPGNNISLIGLGTFI